MIEAVHARRAHAGVEHVAVPALPDGSGAVVDGVEPARILALEKQVVSYVRHTVVGQHGHEDGSTQESCLQAVSMVGEVAAKPFDCRFFRLAFDDAVAQGKERRRLHGVEDGSAERAVRHEEGTPDILVGFVGNLLQRFGVASCGACHVNHHAGVHEPVGGAEVVPVVVCLGAYTHVTVSVIHEDTAAATFERFVAEPVGVLIVAVIVAEAVMVIFGG